MNICHALDQNYFSVKLSSTCYCDFSDFLQGKGGEKKGRNKRKRKVKHIMQELFNKISYQEEHARQTIVSALLLLLLSS